MKKNKNNNKKQLSLSLVLPTFNEKDNVPPLLKKIDLAMKEFDGEYEIIFVDDSNDATTEVIQKEKNKYSNPIHLIHREKSERTGLATAFIVGFNAAKGKYICCMDSDLQHPPKIIPLLLKKGLHDDADIVVATRYIKGGSAEGLGSLKTFYGWYRRAVSLGMKYFTQIIFIPTRKSSDPLGGFFLFKKSLIAGKDLKPQGFKILVEILMKTNHKKVSEVAYTFLKRKNDDSKATIKQGLEFFYHLWSIFKTVPEARRFTNFLTTGFIGAIVNLATLFIFFEIFKTSLNLAWLLGLFFSLLHNYTVNTLFTYGDKKIPSRKKSIQRMLYYYLISLAVGILSFAIFKTGTIYGLNYLLSAFIGMSIAAVISLFLTIKTVWKIK